MDISLKDAHTTASGAPRRICFPILGYVPKVRIPETPKHSWLLPGIRQLWSQPRYLYTEDWWTKCVCVNLCVCVYVHAHMHIHMFAYVHMCECMGICVNVCVCVYGCVCICVCICVWMYVCAYVFTCGHMCLCACVCFIHLIEKWNYSTSRKRDRTDNHHKPNSEKQISQFLSYKESLCIYNVKVEGLFGKRGPNTSERMPRKDNAMVNIRVHSI